MNTPRMKHGYPARFATAWLVAGALAWLVVGNASAAVEAEPGNWLPHRSRMKLKLVGAVNPSMDELQVSPSWIMVTLDHVQVIL